MVPVALVNDYHFWGVVPCVFILEPEPVDKGELAPFMIGDGFSRPGKRQRTEASQPGLVRTRQPKEAEEKEDGTHPGALYQNIGTQQNPVVSPERVEVELQLCVALAKWCPWTAPSIETVQAMQAVSGNIDTRGIDSGSLCLARQRAIQALAYEEVHGPALPEALRYHRGAKRRLVNPCEWQRSVNANGHFVTRSYLAACAGVLGVDALETMLSGARCSRHAQEHRPGNKICCGMQSFTATMVHNWRVLWNSLPRTNRRETLLKFVLETLRNHRGMDGRDEQWRVRYTFLGMPVCKDAFQTLTGTSSFTITEARQGALAGKQSVIPWREWGLSSHITNTNKAASYLSARQWLEHYAATHAEMSPMDDKAYLPAGRKMFYYLHYRRDILQRHGLLESDHPGVLGRTSRRSRCAGSADIHPRVLGRTSRHSNDAGSADVHPEALGRTSRRSSDAGFADIPLARVSTFTQSWRVEVPWLVVCKSVSMFTRCSVCEYLRLLIEQTPREQESLRNVLRERLGQHFDFQAAQRLPHGRVEAERAQSGGRKWLSLWLSAKFYRKNYWIHFLKKNRSITSQPLELE